MVTEGTRSYWLEDGKDQMGRPLDRGNVAIPTKMLGQLLRAAKNARDAIEFGDEQQREEVADEIAEVLLDWDSHLRARGIEGL